ncbi:nickel/cobalt transporter regulator [Paraburkholderia caballeronis]|uniref:RcnB family protein n=1 Tax=Paraburkholderia caballeronis TaxID=416943 RepID=UPI001066397A|nr:RcnB family protein [Paraburkholderia caballeronis]TDV35753.1 nickel/cobalt transporter regulator [Paraburkholderia caballeronis]
MKNRTLARLLAIMLAGASFAAIAAGPPDAGPGRQQVRPSMPYHDWHKGQRVPTEYRHHNFMISDWRSHGLRAPPRGYQWLGVNGDYVLVANRNWTISDIVSGHP